MKTRTYFAHRIDMLDAAGELQEHLAGVEDYILAEAVWREAIARWPGTTPMQDVELNPDVILAAGARVVPILMQLTRSIPIVTLPAAPTPSNGATRKALLAPAGM